MTDLNPVFLPKIVSDRWNEAMEKNDYRTWRACAYIAGLMADDIDTAEPAHVLVPALRAIADKAHNTFISMQPERMEA